MNSSTHLLFAALLGFASLASANMVSYQVSVDTSSLSGDGSLDFQFNPGALDSQSATLQILNFSTDGALLPGPALSGNVSGNLPTTLTFDNGGAFNDYFQGITYGSTLSFQVDLSGPAVDAPDGVATSGSAFAFSLFSDTAGTVPALTTDLTNGSALTVDLGLNGATSVTNFSDATTVAAVPIPATVWLFGSALAGLGIIGKRRQPS
ncbi:NF038129 family PEP-CTERM protein [Methylomagnum sp.]